MRDEGIFIKIQGKYKLIEIGILDVVLKLLNNGIKTIGSCEGHDGKMAWVQVDTHNDYINALNIIKDNNIKNVKILDPKYNGMMMDKGLYWNGDIFVNN